MVYSREDIIELIEAEPSQLHGLLFALSYYASHGDPNLVDSNTNRYGLCQIDLAQARMVGFHDHPIQLLEPAINIRLAAQLLIRYGLIAFLGYQLQPLRYQILQLAKTLTREREHNQYVFQNLLEDSVRR